MATTGEPYAAARRRALNEHNADPFTAAVSAEDIRAAAAAHRELRPEYDDAVVASFIEKVDKAVAARVEARLAEAAQPKPDRPRRGHRQLTRRVARDVLAATSGALLAVGVVGLHGIDGHHAPPPVVLRAASCAGAAASTRPCFVVSGNGQLKAIAPGAASKHR